MRFFLYIIKLDTRWNYAFLYCFLSQFYFFKNKIKMQIVYFVYNLHSQLVHSNSVF